MPSIEALHKKFSKDGLEVIGLDLDVRRKPVEEFLKEFKLTFRILLDPKNKVNRQYGVFGLPATFLINREGMLFALALGARQWDSDCSYEFFGQLLKEGES
jgi:peroxiredoxin